MVSLLTPCWSSFTDTFSHMVECLSVLSMDYFAKAFIDDAVNRGINYEVAKKLASQAIIGSAKMILEADKSIDELIVDVCSPGGATLKGLEVFDNEKLNETIYKASDACIKRAYELSKVKSF